jgi:hypothetical protein
MAAQMQRMRRSWCAQLRPSILRGFAHQHQGECGVAATAGGRQRILFTLQSECTNANVQCQQVQALRSFGPQTGLACGEGGSVAWTSRRPVCHHPKCPPRVRTRATRDDGSKLHTIASHNAEIVTVTVPSRAAKSHRAACARRVPSETPLANTALSQPAVIYPPVHAASDSPALTRPTLSGPLRALC